MIVEREEEIEKFVAREYWSMEADLGESEEDRFSAKLVQIEGRKLEQFDITDEKTATAIKARVEQNAGGQMTVARVKKSQRRRRPQPPFITSTLQQEAARRLGFTTSRTMRVAQQLYEGVNTGRGNEGLITYMRTDSVSLAGVAISDIRSTNAEIGRASCRERVK